MIYKYTVQILLKKDLGHINDFYQANNLLRFQSVYENLLQFPQKVEEEMDLH